MSLFMLTDIAEPLHNKMYDNIRPFKPSFKSKMVKCDQFEVLLYSMTLFLQFDLTMSKSKIINVDLCNKNVNFKGSIFNNYTFLNVTIW